MEKLGLLGGTFSPPHIAHSIIADSVREQLNLDKIIFIPSGNPPLKKSIPAHHRFEMAKLAFGSDKNFTVSDIEIQNQDEKSFTVDTLQKLNEIYHNDALLYLIIGIDKLIELPKWKEPEKLFDLGKVIVLNRPGYFGDNSIRFYDKVNFVNVPFLEISSSMIREKINKGDSIKYLVTEDVENYIVRNNLYGQN